MVFPGGEKQTFHVFGDVPQRLANIPRNKEVMDMAITQRSLAHGDRHQDQHVQDCFGCGEDVKAAYQIKSSSGKEHKSMPQCKMHSIYRERERERERGRGEFCIYIDICA